MPVSNDWELRFVLKQCVGSGLIMVSTLLASLPLTNTWWFWITIGLCVALAAVGLTIAFRRNRVGLIALARHPFAKYVVLSIVAHVALAVWLFSSRLFEAPGKGEGHDAVTVRIESTSDVPRNAEQAAKPWDPPVSEAVQPLQPELDTVDTEPDSIPRPEVNIASDTRVDSPLATVDMGVPIDSPPSPFADQPQPEPMTATDIASNVPEQMPAALPSSSEEDQQVPTLDEQPETMQLADAIPGPDAPEMGATTTDEIQEENVSDDVMEIAKTLPVTSLVNQTPMVEADSSDAQAPSSTSSRFDATPPSSTIPNRADSLPAIYRDRWATDRLAIARRRGGSAETERAVREALVWLAAAQNEDGRWDASQFGSGKPNFEGGHDRKSTGLNADTAVTGLAILCFLGSGHTPLEGEYADVVNRGVQFLLQAQRQRRDGSLVGQSTGFAAMYCHGIATLAISEAYALTGDNSLKQPVQRAIEFTLSAQHPTTGGWRYAPHQPGDTSQLGWQLMALTSAYYAGLVPRASPVWKRANTFLDSVSSGSYGGLASYRAGERPTPAMTAEAALCRLFLGSPPSSGMMNEATNYVANNLPGRGRVNYYYWYYGTLALYHMHDANWLRWNSAVKQQLLRLQSTDGSWHANSVWGPSGGKVYSTALATLTLEVYYRYRPLAEPQRRPQHTAQLP